MILGDLREAGCVSNWNNSRMDCEEEEEEERSRRKRDNRRKGDFVLRGVVKVTSPLSRRYGGIKQTDPPRHGLSHYSTPSILDCDRR